MEGIKTIEVDTEGMVVGGEVEVVMETGVGTGGEMIEIVGSAIGTMIEGGAGKILLIDCHINADTCTSGNIGGSIGEMVLVE